MAAARKPKIYIIANPAKSGQNGPLQHVRQLVEPKGQILDAQRGPLDPALARQADRVIVLGGDGTILAAARAMQANQVPLVGINLGKLGYLAAFSLEEFESNIDAALTDDSLISPRLMLEVTVNGTEGEKLTSIAMNDVVIQAGPPFRMVSLALYLNDNDVTRISGDGLIVATPVGSTAYNLSAGGPILQPTVKGLAITPICAHSLTHKPLVVDENVTVTIVPERLNDGTRVILDGQDMLPVSVGDKVTVRRFPRDFLLVANPGYAPWYTLVTKLKWGQAPVR